MSTPTTRLGLPKPDIGDAFLPHSDIGAIADGLDPAAIYEQGALGSKPAGTAKPYGYWYADTASGGRVWVNVGTGGGRVYRSLATGAQVDALAGAWREHGRERSGYMANASGGGISVLLPPDSTANQAPAIANIEAAFYLDPADYAASGYTIEWRLVLTYFTNVVAPGRAIGLSLQRDTFTDALVSGVSGARDTMTGAGTGVGTAATTGVLGADATGRAVSAAFALTTAGIHSLVVQPSGGVVASGSITTLQGALQYRYVLA